MDGRHFWSRHLGYFPLASKSPLFWDVAVSDPGVHRNSWFAAFGGEVHWQLRKSKAEAKAEALTPFCPIHRKLPKIWDHSLDILQKTAGTFGYVLLKKNVGL